MAIRSITVRSYFILLFIFLLGKGFAQSLDAHFLKSVPLKNPDLLEVDSRGNIFVSDLNGTLRQFDENGDSLNIYAPSFTAGLQQLECHWTVSIFLFSSDRQQIEILDRFLNPLSSTRIADLGISGLISHATLGNNNVLWMFDETDLNLKKFDFRNKQMQQEQPLNILLPESKLDILSMVERKNLLFLHLKDEGIYIFDNQGNPIRNIPIRSNFPIEIVNEFIFFIRDQVMVKKNYLNDKEEELALPRNSYDQIAISGNRLILKGLDFIEIYQRPSGW